jgi:hypothetical protein
VVLLSTSIQMLGYYLKSCHHCSLYIIYNYLIVLSLGLVESKLRTALLNTSKLQQRNMKPLDDNFVHSSVTFPFIGPNSPMQFILNIDLLVL